jgi:hypothetical protein
MNFTELNGKLYFRAQQVQVGTELFVYDPVTDDFELEFDSYPGQYDLCPDPDYPSACLPYGNDGWTRNLTLKDDKFYYVGNFDEGELWEYDPATGQGQQMFDFWPGVDPWGAILQSLPEHLTPFNGSLFFQASTDAALYELFIVSWSHENCP